MPCHRAQAEPERVAGCWYQHHFTRGHSASAGLLLGGSEDASEGERPRPGPARSAVLLLGRLMLAALFVFVGVNQVSGAA